MRGPASLAFGLFGALLALGCDASSSSDVVDLGELVKGDPSYEGEDIDVGAEDMGPTPVELHGKLRVVGRHLQNEHGENVQLKGVSSMWLNWERTGYAENLTALRWMRNNWKLNVIRAAMGIEPAGAYLADPEYARGQVERIIENAIAAGVYVVVDWHDHNAEDHVTESVAFFESLAEKYSGVPNLIYETYNEPETSDWTVVKAYHETVVAAIRKKDPEAIIVLGTPRYDQLVDLAASDPLEGENLMYTLHYYACDHNYRSAGDVALSKGLALMVTEWGATTADGGLDGNVCAVQAQQWDDWLRARGISWMAWKLDDCEPDATCLLVPGAPLEGGWTNQYLRGHARFVRGRMQQ